MSLPDITKNTTLPWQHSLEDFKKLHIPFRTSAGSLYIYRNGQSIRIKTPHKLHEAKDIGIKEPSTYTLFMSPKDAQIVGMYGQLDSHENKRIVLDPKENMVYLSARHPKKKNEQGIFHKFKYSLEPKKDLHPLELFERSSQSTPDYLWFRGWHAGNSISEFVDPEEAYKILKEHKK